MEQLLQSFEEQHDLHEKLVMLRALPQHRYETVTGKSCRRWFQLLRVASAHLEVVFSERGQVDFTALVLAAIQALGDPQARLTWRWPSITVSGICWWTSFRIPRSASMN